MNIFFISCVSMLDLQKLYLIVLYFRHCKCLYYMRTDCKSARTEEKSQVTNDSVNQGARAKRKITDL